MLSLGSATWVAALLGATTVHAACSRNLVIDNFSTYSTGLNTLGSQTSDDGSMAYIQSSTASGGYVTFVPKSADSYFYESFSCRSAKTDGYSALTFAMTGPAGGSVAVEIQTQSSCQDTTYSSSYYVIQGVTAASQTYTIPLTSFDPPPNPDAIVAFAWSQFTSSASSTWALGSPQLVCGATAPTTSPPPPPGVSTTTRPTTTVGPPTTTIVTTTRPTTTSPSGCKNLLIDDWESQSRLTFLNYNSLQQSTSDDGSMKSIVVDSHRVMLVPQDTESYFYSDFGCVNATGLYGGISFRIRAAAYTTFAVTLTSTTDCGGQATKQVSKTTAQLAWTFDGTEKLYYLPWTTFAGLDITKLQMIYLSNFNGAVILGPMSMYCGNTPSEYIPPATPSGTAPVSNTAAAPPSTATPFVIDAFGATDTNALGQWHGADDGLTSTFGRGSMTIKTNDSDLGWNSQFTDTCVDMRQWSGAYLHVSYSGSNKFTIALQQHNAKCNNTGVFPETWDSIEAARYATATDIYVPISHFNINLQRVIGLSFKGFYSTDPTVFYKVEIVDSVPASFRMPQKLDSGTLVFQCTRPNSFAFAIDDGEPSLAQQVMEIVKSEGITVTFFTVGLPLLDSSTNLSTVYKDMQKRGHQIAMHSYTHPKMEGLPDTASIDWEYNNDIGAVKQVFNGMTTPYFRPPFGTEGARMRQRLAATMGIKNPYIIQWSIDVEDWQWAETKTPEKQLTAFKRDLAKGGNLVVMHYLYPSTVNYLRQFIKLAKATGKQLMRVDQCMMDPNAPPLPS